MLIINIKDNPFVGLFKKNNKNKIIRLTQYTAPGQVDLWKIVFANRDIKIVRLNGDSYRSRWWLVLNFQTLDQHKRYSIVISRFFYPSAVYRKLCAHLWFYV